MTIILIALILCIIGLDQLTKWLTVVYMTEGQSIPIWQDVLHLTFYKNPGAAFGILDEPGQRWIFLVFSSVAIVGLLVYLFFFRPKNRFMQLTLAMIVGGGIGNMIDRIYLGYVIDFIDVELINFAIFNVADSFVTVGAFLLIGYLIWDMIREMKVEKAAKAAQTEVKAETAPVEAPTEETSAETANTEEETNYESN